MREMEVLQQLLPVFFKWGEVIPIASMGLVDFVNVFFVNGRNVEYIWEMWEVIPYIMQIYPHEWLMFDGKLCR